MLPQLGPQRLSQPSGACVAWLGGNTQVWPCLPLWLSVRQSPQMVPAADRTHWAFSCRMLYSKC